MAEITKLDEALVEFTAEIVAAYVSNNAISSSDLGKLIADVYSAVSSTLQPAQHAPAPALVPAISIRKSVTPDYIVCLEDGKKFKSMKRHVIKLGMSPEQYRAKWNLPADYPMVAASYSARRSDLAKTNGLGRKAGEVVAKTAPTKAKRKPAAAV